MLRSARCSVSRAYTMSQGRRQREKPAAVAVFAHRPSSRSARIPVQQCCPAARATRTRGLPRARQDWPPLYTALTCAISSSVRRQSCASLGETHLPP